MSSKNVRLFGPAQLTNAAATKYTVPASTVTIIQYLTISNPTGGAVAFTMSIGADAAGTRVYDAYSIPAGTTLTLFVKYVLAAAEIVQAFASANTSLVMTLNGQELTPG